MISTEKKTHQDGQYIQSSAFSNLAFYDILRNVTASALFSNRATGCRKIAYHPVGNFFKPPRVLPCRSSKKNLHEINAYI